MNKLQTHSHINRKIWNRLKSHRDRHYPEYNMDCMIEHCLLTTLNQERKNGPLAPRAMGSYDPAGGRP